MKFVFLTLGLVLLTATNALGASVTLPISARIINLTTMPVQEAIAFCDEHNMACPALREKSRNEKQIAIFPQQDKADGQNEDTIRISADGYYIE